MIYEYVLDIYSNVYGQEFLMICEMHKRCTIEKINSHLNENIKFDCNEKPVKDDERVA